MKKAQCLKYKDSGVDWIGKIPEGWEIRKIKHFARMFTGTTPDSGNERYWDGDVIWVTPADLSQRKKYISDSRRNITKEGYESCGTKYVKKKAIILATRAPIGYATIVGAKLCFNQGCKAFEIQKEYYPDYVYYYLNSFEDVLISRGNATTFSELSMYDLSSFEVPKPSMAEQTQIADYLDAHNSRIDNAIEKDNSLIGLLKEKRTALINQVVTRGLDPEATLKDSGIDWIGKIPEGWVVVPFKKYLESIIDYRGATPDKTDEGVFLVTGRNIKSGRIDYDISREYVYENQYEEIMHKGKPRVGDLLFTTEAPLGEVANVDEERIALAQRIIKMRGKKNKLDNFYLKYYVMSSSFQGHLQSQATGSTALGIKANNMCFLKLLVPTRVEEQKQIVKFLDRETSRMDQLIQKVKRRSDLLEEHKTSLINNVVIGRVDVREQNGLSSKAFSQYPSCRDSAKLVSFKRDSDT
jgi:type I restriction enzyme S subunit